MSVRFVMSSVLLTMTTKQNMPLIACVVGTLFTEIKSRLPFLFQALSTTPSFPQQGWFVWLFEVLRLHVFAFTNCVYHSAS